MMINAIWSVVWGATWGNNMAAVEWAIAIGVVGWLGRHQIGRQLAAWWDRHHGPMAIERHRQALREHDEEKLILPTVGRAVALWSVADEPFGHGADNREQDESGSPSFQPHRSRRLPWVGRPVNSPS